LYTTQIRTFGNFFDTSTYGHSSIVVLVQERCDEQQTGTYKCRGVDKPNLSTSFHLYFKGIERMRNGLFFSYFYTDMKRSLRGLLLLSILGEYGFPSLQNVVVQLHENDTKALLPCPTSDPTSVIGLYKVAPPVYFSSYFIMID